MSFIATWLVQRLTGVVVQAVAATALVATLIGGLAWLRHDAVMSERAAWQVKIANARAQELLLRQRRERDAAAVGSRAEKDLLKELDASDSIINELEKKLASKPVRTVCYPKEIVQELNR